MPWLDFNTTPHLRLREGIHGAIHHSDRLTFARIILEEGAVLPDHQHPNEQWTHVLGGRMEFTLDGETRVLEPGMAVHIPPMTRHGARALTRVEAMDCFWPAREDFKALEPWSGT